MNRKEKEIIEKSDIEAVIQKALVCRIGLSCGNIPYVVPVCFGYEPGVIYAHGSPEGKKNDLVKKNPNVCFEFDIDAEIVNSKTPCGWTMKYKSVIGFGAAFFLENPDEKRRALKVIAGQYSDQSCRFPDSAVNATAVIKIEISSMTGKQSGFPD